MKFDQKNKSIVVFLWIEWGNRSNERIFVLIYFSQIVTQLFHLLNNFMLASIVQIVLVKQNKEKLLNWKVQQNYWKIFIM